MSTRSVTLAVVSATVGLFLLYNAFWFIWRGAAFGRYCDGMERAPHSNAAVPRHYATDADGYGYFVRYPDYLALIGYMTVMVPVDSEEEDALGETLIIWRRLGGGREYGVLLFEGDGGRWVHIGPGGNALHGGDEDIAGRNGDVIKTLLKKAGDMWGIP